MKKTILILFITIFSVQFSFAQSSKVNNAYFLMDDYRKSKNSKDLIKAKEAIDEASKNESTSLKGKTWYYRALIYKLLSEDKETKTNGIDYSSESLVSFKKALSVNDKKFRDDDKVLAYLKEMSLNSFNSGVESFKTRNYKDAYSKFINTKNINSVITENGKKAPVKLETVVEYSAIVAGNAGMNQESLDLYKELMVLQPDSNHYFRVAKLYEKVGDQDMYSKTLEDGAKAFPDDANIIIEQLRILMKAGKMDEAISKIDKAIELDPKNKQLYFIKAKSLADAGKDDEAIGFYEKAIELDSEYADAIYNLGTIYFLKPNQYVKEMNSLGMGAADQKRYDELKELQKVMYLKAKPYFERVLEIKPSDSFATKAINKINLKIE